jgi:hypothetical protein
VSGRAPNYWFKQNKASKVKQRSPSQQEANQPKNPEQKQKSRVRQRYHSPETVREREEEMAGVEFRQIFRAYLVEMSKNPQELKKMFDDRDREERTRWLRGHENSSKKVAKKQKRVSKVY